MMLLAITKTIVELYKRMKYQRVKIKKKSYGHVNCIIVLYYCVQVHKTMHKMSTKNEKSSAIC